MAYTLLSILAALASYAQAGEPVQATAAARTDAGKKICRMIVPTGSIMAKRFCLTKQEWKDMNEQTQESAGTAWRRRGTGMCDIQCPGS